MITHKCNKSCCNTLISINSKYCDKHQHYYSRKYDKQRMTNKLTREYRLFYQSKAWRDLRSYKLDKNPLCEKCLLQGKSTIATDVHHIDDVFNHWNERLKIDNLEALCKPCHEKIHKLGYYNGLL